MSESGVTPLVRLRPELLEDVTEAYSWYELRAEGVGMDFTRAFYAAVSRASRHPKAARIVYDSFRRARLRRFPHSLYYRAEETETVFFLLFHGARNPSTLRRKLQARQAD